jgi:hypothetical protein
MKIVKELAWELRWRKILALLWGTDKKFIAVRDKMQEHMWGRTWRQVVQQIEHCVRNGIY